MPSNKIIVILGKKGSGKTEYCRAMMKDLRRFIAYDPVRQFNDGIIFHNPHKLLDFVIRNFHINHKIIYQPDIETTAYEKDDNEKATQEFDLMCRIVQYSYNVNFVIDEVDMYTSANKCPSSFKNLVMRGRHRQISIICTTRRHTETSRHLTAQADVIVSFRQQEPNDIKYLGQFFGEKAQSLPTLEQYHYIKYENGETTIQKPIKI